MSPSRGSQVAHGASLENWFSTETMGSNPIPCATSKFPVSEGYVDYLLEVREKDAYNG